MDGMELLNDMGEEDRTEGTTPDGDWGTDYTYFNGSKKSPIQQEPWTDEMIDRQFDTLEMSGKSRKRPYAITTVRV